MKVDLKKALAKKLVVFNKCHSDEDYEINDLWKYTAIDDCQYIPFVKIKGNDGIITSADEKQAHIPIDDKYVEKRLWIGNNLKVGVEQLPKRIEKRYEKFVSSLSSTFYNSGFYGMVWYLLTGEILEKYPEAGGWSTSGDYPKWQRGGIKTVRKENISTTLYPGCMINENTCYFKNENDVRESVSHSLVVDVDETFITMITYSKNTDSPSGIKTYKNSDCQTSIFYYIAPDSLSLYKSSTSHDRLSDKIEEAGPGYESQIEEQDSWTIQQDDYVVYVSNDDISGSGVMSYEEVSKFISDKDFFKVSEYQEHINDGLNFANIDGRNFPLRFANEVFAKGSGNALR